MSSISSLALPPLSVIYAAVTQTRLAAYKRGLLKATRLDVPVISVGNITTGGTGKTPLVEWVCRALARKERKICILTRGYGRVRSNARVVVSDGSTILAESAESGDEPYLLAENLKGIAAVISDSDRAAAGKWALEHLGVDVFVLDDGFQHLRLERDLNILTIDATNPWGGGHLLPYGRLRETPRGLSRADCVVITRAEQSADLGPLKEKIRQVSRGRPIWVSRMQTKAIRRIASGTPAAIASLPKPAAAFCGVGNPNSFFEHLRREQVDLVFTRTFPDHHGYDQAEIDSLTREAKRLGARSLVTTAKDAVKLQSFDFDLPCYVLEIEISIDQEDQLVQLIGGRLSER